MALDRHIEGRRQVLMRLLVTGLSVAVSSCGNGRSDDLDDAQSMRSRFRSLVGPNYACDYQNQFFVAGPIVEPVRMTVRSSQITSLVSLQTSEPIPGDLWPHFLTVEGVFDAIEDAARRDVAELRVRYDERYSYPAETYIDVDARAIDEERRYLISNLEPEA
jgi:hypothetical protein